MYIAFNNTIILITTTTTFLLFSQPREIGREKVNKENF